MSEVKSTAEACYDARMALIKERDELTQQISAYQLSQQNIINAFGIKGEGAHSKLVIEYVHGLVAENAELRRIALGYHILTVPEREAPTEPEIDAALAEIKSEEAQNMYESILDNPSVYDMESLIDSLESYAENKKAFAANLRAGRKG